MTVEHPITIEIDCTCDLAIGLYCVKTCETKLDENDLSNFGMNSRD